MREMVDCMYEKVYTEGQLVIQEGEPGNYLYVLAGQLNTIHVALMGHPEVGKTMGGLQKSYFLFMSNVPIMMVNSQSVL